MKTLQRKTSDYVTNCLRPLSIVNNSTHDTLSVPCGHCVACKVRASNTETSKLDYVIKHSAFNYFFTLTYNDECLPVATWRPFTNDFETERVKDFVYLNSYYQRTKKNSSKEKVPVYDVQTIRPDGLEVGALAPLDFSLLRRGIVDYKGVPRLNTLGQNYTFGYVCRVDVVNFVKRVRKALFNIFNTYENLFIYIIAEYGPSTLRPHYHGVISTDAVLPYGQALECIRGAWKLGNIDVQNIQTNASSYVASYVSGSANLPRYLQVKEFRPFRYSSQCSSYFSNSQSLREVFSQLFVDETKKYVRESTDGTSAVDVPLSVNRFLYPKCFRFGQSNRESLDAVYHYFQHGYVTVPRTYARRRGFSGNLRTERERFYYEDSRVNVNDLCKLSRECVGYTMDGKPVFSIPNYYYTDFLWTKHVNFLAFFFRLSISEVLDHIYNLYQKVAYENLKELYRSPCDNIFDSLLASHTFSFYAYRKLHSSQWPEFLIRGLKLQGIYDSVFNNDGTFTDAFSQRISSIRHHIEETATTSYYKHIKTKYLNDAYGIHYINPYNV